MGLFDDAERARAARSAQLTTQQAWVDLGANSYDPVPTKLPSKWEKLVREAIPLVHWSRPPETPLRFYANGWRLYGDIVGYRSYSAPDGTKRLTSLTHSRDPEANGRPLPGVMHEGLRIRGERENGDPYGERLIMTRSGIFWVNGTIPTLWTHGTADYNQVREVLVQYIAVQP